MDIGQNPHERAEPQREEKPKRKKMKNSKEIPPVLTLNKTDDLVNRIKEVLQKEENERYKTIRMYLHQPDSEKYKVSNLPARKIQIGNWQRTTDKDDDLVAKFFFRMKLLAWEIIEGGLTKKIEMRWKDVSALRATYSEGHPSILNVELENPPNFFVEDDPQPRRHRKWIEIPDFTNGEAQRCRIHTLTVPEGILEEHYDKLIHNDGLLFCMNGWSFPIKNSPFSNPTQSQASSSSFITSSAVHKSLMNTSRDLLIPGSNFHSTNTNAQMNSRVGAYSTPASNGYPRRVVCIPDSNFNGSSLNEVAGGIQTSHGTCRASIDENAQYHMSMNTMPSQSVSNFHPTNVNGQMNSGLNYGSFTINVNAQESAPFVRESSMITNKELPIPANNSHPSFAMVKKNLPTDANAQMDTIKDRCFATVHNHQVQCMEGYSTKAPSVYPRNLDSSPIKVAQTSQSLFRSNGGEHNQNREHGFPMEEDINLRTEENTLNHMFMSSIPPQSGNNFHPTNASAQVNSRRVVCIPGSTFDASSLNNVVRGSQASQGTRHISTDESAQTHMSMSTMPSQSGHSLHPTNVSAQVSRNQDQSVEAYQTPVPHGSDQSSNSAPVRNLSNSSSKNSNGSSPNEVLPVEEKSK